MAVDDPTEAQIQRAEMIVIGAIAAAGNMNSSVAWKSRINQLVPEVAAVLGPRSFQMRRALMMLDAAVFSAPFVEAKLEESSTRMIVSLEHAVDKDHPDGREHVRTERTDQPTGKRMAERLADVKAGQTLLCWKVLEEMRGGENAGRSVRILMHFETLPTRAPGGAGSKAPEPASGGAAPVPSNDGDISTPELSAFSELTKDWDGKTMVALVNELRGMRLWPPTHDNISEVLKATKEWSF